MKKRQLQNTLILGAINVSQLHPARSRRRWFTEGLAVGIALNRKCFEDCAICTVPKLHYQSHTVLIYNLQPPRVAGYQRYQSSILHQLLAHQIFTTNLQTNSNRILQSVAAAAFKLKHGQYP